MGERIVVWITENWIVAILPFLGALVAHMKEYERLAKEQPLKWHVYGYLSRTVYAVFAVLLVGNIIDYYNVPKQLGYIAIGLFSVKPDALINWLFDYLAAFVDKWKGKQP